MAALLVLGVLLVAALFAAGCGGGDGGGSTAVANGDGTAAAAGDTGVEAAEDPGPSAATLAADGRENESGISKKAFLRKAEAICTQISGKGQARLITMVGEWKDPEKALKEVIERADEVVEQVVAPLYREEIERIRDLGYPRGDGEEIEAMLLALEEVVQRAEADPQAFAKLPTVEGEARNPYRRADALARRYGFKVCPRV